MQYNFNKNTTIENRKMLVVKMDYILKCNVFLGIESTCVRKTISRKKIESSYNYLKAEHDSIVSIFGFKNPDKDPFKLLKKLYESWNLCCIKALKNGHKKVEEYLFDSLNTYVDDNDFQILPFLTNIEQSRCRLDFTLIATSPTRSCMAEPIDETIINKFKASPSEYYDNHFGIGKQEVEKLPYKDSTYDELQGLPIKIEEVSDRILPYVFTKHIKKINEISNYFKPTYV